MTKNKFKKEYDRICREALFVSSTARREGLLVLEKHVDRKAVEKRDIFHYGLSFVIDGMSTKSLKKILTNIVDQEKNPKRRLLKTIEKEAVLCIQRGNSPIAVFAILNSLTPFSLDEDDADAILEENL